MCRACETQLGYKTITTAQFSAAAGRALPGGLETRRNKRRGAAADGICSAIQRLTMITTMTKLILRGLVVLALLTGSRGDALAGEQWCETDPLVVISTPKGGLVPVFVTNGAAGIEHLVHAQLAEIRYTTGSVEGGMATLVRMAVTVPSGIGGIGGSRFETSSVVSTGPLKTGTILASAKGMSGQTMHMEFKLSTP